MQGAQRCYSLLRILKFYLQDFLFDLLIVKQLVEGITRSGAVPSGSRGIRAVNLAFSAYARLPFLLHQQRSFQGG